MLNHVKKFYLSTSLHLKSPIQNLFPTISTLSSPNPSLDGTSTCIAPGVRRASYILPKTGTVHSLVRSMDGLILIDSILTHASFRFVGPEAISLSFLTPSNRLSMEQKSCSIQASCASSTRNATNLAIQHLSAPCAKRTRLSLASAIFPH